MDITFDTNKDILNQQKHGTSLAEAAEIEWETLYAKSDNRADYGEVRMIGYTYLGLRLINEQRRIISLRKANKREIKRYAEA